MKSRRQEAHDAVLRLLHGEGANRRWWTQLALDAAHRLGFHVERYGGLALGVDPLHDIQLKLEGMERPIVFDVGANYGQSVVQFRALLPGCEIHAFEPSAWTFDRLTANVGHLPDVHLSKVAVGAVEETRPLLENSSPVMTSFLPLGDQGWGQVVAETPVNVVTVDAYCANRDIPRIDLLKIDTQGFELEVLRGAAELFARGRVRLVFMEVTFSRMYENLPSLDALYRFLVDRGLALVAFYDFSMRDGLAGWTDCLFANPDLS